MKKLFIWLAGCAAVISAAAGPMDNLQSDYRNAVFTNNVYGTGVAQNGLSLGLGAGVYWTTNRYFYDADGDWYRYSNKSSLANNAKKMVNFRSTIGTPISSVSAN